MMFKHLAHYFTIAASVIVISACSGPERQESTQQMVDKYIEFYFPSTGRFFYTINFDWGNYEIYTFPKPDEEVHADSEPYRGYVTLRPNADADEAGQPLNMYVITPGGEVWFRARDPNLAEVSERQEETVTRDSSGTMTSTTTIRTTGEPLIDDLRANPSRWQRYGQLTPTADGSTSTLKKTAN